jgi:hypothetical protein
LTQGRELFRSAVEENVRSNKERSNPLLHEDCEGRLDVAFDNGFDDHQL